MKTYSRFRLNPQKSIKFTISVRKKGGSVSLVLHEKLQKEQQILCVEMS
jgi:hypothetical protein